MSVCTTADSSCDFDNFSKISCSRGNFNFIYECKNDTDGHLSYLQALERISDKRFQCYSFPESVLLLYRSGIFIVDKQSLSLRICQAHRDYFGISWRWNKQSCGYPAHKKDSKAKPDRGANPSLCKLYWLKTRQIIQVGSGICKQCATKHKKDFLEFPLNYEEDIAQCNQILQTLNGDRQLPNSEDSEKSEHSTCNYPNYDSQSWTPFMSQTTSAFSQQSHSDWEEENSTSRDRFNQAMSILSNGTFSCLNSQLNLPWAEISKSSKSNYLKIASDAIHLVLEHVVPGQEEEVMADIIGKFESSKIIEKQVDDMTKALIEAYLSQNNRLNQMQILSLFASKFSKERLLTLIPGLTISKIDAARKHAVLTSPGQIISPPKIYRMRLSNHKVLHFIEFISSPTYHQAVGFGSKTLTLSSGVEIKIPRIVRSMLSSRLIKSYLAYCEDLQYQTFSRSTLFNILKVCLASQKKNMHGLDNITGDGMKAIETVTKIIQKLETFGLDAGKVTELTTFVAHINQHLKFEIKGHVQRESSCIDHCTVYSLNDPVTEVYRSKCTHDHTEGCADCGAVEKTIQNVMDAIEDIKVNIPSDSLEEINHDLSNSTSNLFAWKAHCIRTVHQNEAKQDILQKLKPNQALVVMDWSMKFLPIKHRETQSDFFGKKGISWHMSSVVTCTDESEDTEKKFQVQTFVHILQLGSQGWFSVAHIITDLLQQISRWVHPCNTPELEGDEIKNK